jgi:hypothetical protein
VLLSVLVGIGTVVSAVALIDRQPALVLIIGLTGCVIALTLWWRQASAYVSEPDPLADDPRPFSARLAADVTIALFGVGIIALCVVQILSLGESQIRWALLATILGGPFIALGLGTAWERWNTHTFG